MSDSDLEELELMDFASKTPLFSMNSLLNIFKTQIIDNTKDEFEYNGMVYTIKFMWKDGFSFAKGNLNEILLALGWR